MFGKNRVFGIAAIRWYFCSVPIGQRESIARAKSKLLSSGKKVSRPLVSMLGDLELELEPKRMKCADSSSSGEEFGDISTTDSGENDSFDDSQTREKVKTEVTAKRQWSLSRFGRAYSKGKVPDSGLDFTIMTYNILSQDLLESHLYLYSHCRPEHLEWPYRFENLKEEIASHSADIVCLQELQENHFKDCFNPFMEELGYKGIYKKKTGSKCDGCAIFFKTSVFVLDSYFGIEFKKFNVSTLDRDNIALLAFLKPVEEKFSNSKLCVATTHLLFNPKRGDVKLSQLRLLLAELEKQTFISSTDGLRLYGPIILCGDMNSAPFSPLYNFIRCGEIRFEGMVSGDISGQEEGFNKGRMLTPDVLDLSDIGINNETQYTKKMTESSTHLPNAQHYPTAVQVEASDKNSSNQQNPSDKSDKPSNEAVLVVKTEPIVRPNIIFDVSTYYTSSDKPKKCHLTHNLHFASVYNHGKSSSNEQEITTQNKRVMCTVDYIFYNLKHKRCVKLRGQCTIHANILENEVKFMGTYKLLCPGDVKSIGGLPNAYLSSDHLCLISRFLLCPRK